MGKKFTRAFFLNGACYGHKDGLFRKDLQSIGIVAYMGWTVATQIATAANHYRVYYMAQENNLQQVMTRCR